MTTTGTAIVASRTNDGPVDTAEIRALAESAGYEVLEEVTQTRPPDPGSYLGAGAVDRLVSIVAATDATTVIIDDRITPAQHRHLSEALPPGTELLDRYRLVLDIFAEGATTRRATLQVERARLQYELRHIEAEADEGMLNKRVEKGSQIYDVRDRIDELGRKLEELPTPAEQFRRQRQAEGFDLVTIAGYTNAGKSTLLHRLADDLDLADRQPDHPDRDVEVAVADRLFETLETTTRRTSVADRPVLLTDTVGFVDDLPHDLIESFGETLSEAAAADAVVLVADGSDPVEAITEKLQVAMDTLDAQGVDRADVVTALNKVDRLDDSALEQRLAASDGVAPRPMPISAVEGRGIDRLIEAVRERLPTRKTTIEAPNCDEMMSVVSRAYDRTAVEDISYEGGRVTIDLRGRPAVVEQLEAAASGVTAEFE